jgi:hypothetical protein
MPFQCAPGRGSIRVDAAPGRTRLNPRVPSCERWPAWPGDRWAASKQAATLLCRVASCRTTGGISAKRRSTSDQRDGPVVASERGPRRWRPVRRIRLGRTATCPAVSTGECGGRTLLTGTDRPVKRGKEHPSRSPSDLVRFAPRGCRKRAPRQAAEAISGGDGGSRTPVQSVQPWICYRLSRCSTVAARLPPTGSRSAEPDHA